MIQTNITSKYTEIYVGGGNFITQSKTTNFHQFYTRKILTANEHIDDFREVTAKERQVLEQADAGWVAPTEELIAQAEAAGAVYNRETGFFELNGLTDITAEQMRAVLLASGKYATAANNVSVPLTIASDMARTNIPLIVDTLGLTVNAVGRKYEVLAFKVGYSYATVSFSQWALSNMPKLKKITGEFFYNLTRNNFIRLPALEEIRMKRIKSSISFDSCPKLSLASLQYMVANAANTEPITITLHPEAYARITDELFALAAEKNITFASV